MSTFVQRLLNIALSVAFASLFVWHGGKTALFLFVVTLLIGASGWIIQICGPRNIHIRRHMHSERMMSGEEAHVRVELEFESHIPLLWIVLCENTPAGVHRKCFFPGMRRQFTYQYQLSGLRRGVYEWGKGRLYWGDIFGWNTLSVETVGDTPLIVVPSVTGYGENDSNVFGATGEGLMSERRNSHGKRSPEFREYQHGDPLGRIHWKSTAKTGRLQTFLPEMMDSPSLGILVYEGQSGYEQPWNGSSDHPAFERVVSMAARWIQRAALEDMPYHLWMGSGDAHVGDQEQPIRYSIQSDHRNLSLDQLAEAQIAPVSSDSPSLMETTRLEYMPSGSRIVVLSGRMDADLHEWILYAASLGHTVEVQLTELAVLSEFNSNTDRQQSMDLAHHTDGKRYPRTSGAHATQSQSSAWLEQLYRSGVNVRPVASRSLPPLGKVVVTDVGA
ncbi:DUF58 domain-containing protein [Paenibacillus sp. PCH8]|uniref:DUF58 domain-containing protein n=1 Tax=Paenibacillus sp. PCH8 TaxID=2066524 RepID=UPI0015E345D6|nr:DUF58 domain-containing protein [Paenibacillus sp. PCH8]